MPIVVQDPGGGRDSNRMSDTPGPHAKRYDRSPAATVTLTGPMRGSPWHRELSDRHAAMLCVPGGTS
jgi:hypothetical protein